MAERQPAVPLIGTEVLQQAGERVPQLFQSQQLRTLFTYTGIPHRATTLGLSMHQL